MERMTFTMWKCKNCGAENGDASVNCSSCGERRTNASAKSTAAKSAAQSAGAPFRSSEEKKYVRGNCWQANDLEKWGWRFSICCIVLAVIQLIASGFTYEMNRWGELELTFRLSAMAGGIIPAVCWVGGGYAFRLILESFALVVEAAYKFIHFHE